MKSVKNPELTGAGADFYWPQLTIGSTTDAIRFAITNKTFLLFNSFPTFNSYDLLRDLTSEEEAWAAAAYNAADLSLLPFSGALEKIRVDGHTLVAHTRSGGVYTIAFEQIDLFATKNIFGLEDCFTKTLQYNRVVDWFDVLQGGSTPCGFDLSQHETIKQTTFYESGRVDGREYYDLFCVSHLTDEQLMDYEYSDTFIKFKIVKSAQEKLSLNLWKRDVFKIYEIMYNDEYRENINWRGKKFEEY